MEKTVKRSNFYLLLIFIISLSGCKGDQKAPVNPDMYMVDTLVTKYNYDSYERPDKVLAELAERRTHLKDSLSYHRLSDYMATFHHYNNNTDSAFLYSRSALKYFMKQDSNNLVVVELKSYAYNNISMYFLSADQADSSIYYLQKAAEESAKTDNLKMASIIYLNIGSSFHERGNLSLAADNFRKALLIIEPLEYEDKHFLISVYYDALARLYIDLQNYDLANYYLEILEGDYDKLEPYEQNVYLMNRGQYHYAKKEYDEALEWYSKSYEIAKTLKREDYVALTEGNIGEMYLLLNNLDSAKVYIDKSARYMFSVGENAADILYVKGLYASLYLEQNNLKEAERILDEIQNSPVTDQILAYANDKRFEALYKKRGDYRRAYEFSERADVYDDSIRNITLQNNIAEIDMRYRQDTTLLRRDVVIAQKEQRVLELQSINIIIVSLLIVIVLSVVAIVIYIRRRRDMQYARQVATITALRMENVRNRISPHFMFNVLNSVMPSLRQHEDLSLPLQLLIESIRGNLLVSEKVAVTLYEETSIVRNYISLYKSINPSAFEIKWDIGTDVDMETLLPSMIIQIPLENAIKYAFDSVSKDNLISIEIASVSDYLSVVIQDNGIGFDPARFLPNEKGTGSGLRILYKTIELLNTRNQQKIKFRILNLEDESPDTHGTKVQIDIPFDYKFNL